MLGAWRPFRAMPAASYEHAARAPILELDESVGALSAVAYDSIGRELTKKRNLDSQAIVGRQARIIGSH